MKFSYTVDRLIEILQPIKIVGITNVNICGLNTLINATAGEISFLGNMKYKKDVISSFASVILVPLDFTESPKENQCFLFFKNPSYAFGILCRDIENQQLQHPIGIHPSAIISETAIIGNNVAIDANVVVENHAVIGDNTIIYPGCYIGPYVKIGKNCTFHSHIQIMRFCEVGNNVNLFSGVVIGSDGFGYEDINGIHEKIPQIGNVVIEDNVDIGANTTIDRARFGSTVIGKGTKIDNLVQIGHNVKIGQNCIIVAQTGIAGSTVLGNYVIVGGQVGIAGHLNIPDCVMIAAKSAVSSYHTKLGKGLRGNPARPISEINKIYILERRLPELFKRVSSIEEALKIKI